VTGAVLLLAIAVLLLAGTIAAGTWVTHRHRNESGLGSDEEFVRELLGYQPSHWPMNGRRDPDDESAAT